MELYTQKETSYFKQIREDLVQCIPSNPENKVLEIGAGACDTLVTLKVRNLAKVIYGIELCTIPNSNQQNPLIDGLYIGNIEESFPDYPQGYFDVILCGDVLEHLIDPWAVINKLVQYLTKDGIIIICCPNMREITNWMRILITGRFQYQPAGVMDKTHLRFFCKKDLIDLAKTDKLLPIKAFGNYYNLGWRKAIRPLHFGLLDEFMTFQNIVISQKR